MLVNGMMTSVIDKLIFCKRVQTQSLRERKDINSSVETTQYKGLVGVGVKSEQEEFVHFVLFCVLSLIGEVFR